MNAFSHSSVSPPATTAPHRLRIAAANAAAPLAATASVALIGAAVGMAAGVPGMLAGIVLGGVAGLLAARALVRRSIVAEYDDLDGTQIEIGPSSRNAWRPAGRTRPPSYPSDKRARRHPTRPWRAMSRWIGRMVGATTMALGLLSAACGLLWAVDDFYCDPNPQPAVLLATVLSAALIAVGFAMWSASSRLQQR
jgi:predicted lipid-binding transport protein (Tim44 family)